ncbi:MAG: AAA-like domain-containing protein [Crinalium sp.]
MNQETFCKIYQEALTPRQKQVLSLFLAGNKDEDILKKIEATHITTVIHHIRNICKKFEIIPEAYSDYRENLLELFLKYKRPLVSPKILEKYGYITKTIPFPDRPEPLNSPYYIARDCIESKCYAKLEEPGALLRIKAPKQMGKTSLLKRIIADANQKNYQTVYLNIGLIDTDKFTNSYSFLRSFYTYFQQKLPNTPAMQEWESDDLLMLNCTRQFQKLLQQLDGVLVLVLDQVDRLFEYPEIYQNFFPMLRNWYEKSKESETWEKLRLVIAYSTEDYGKLGINQSPFNVGEFIKLEEFNLEQMQDLANRHGVSREAMISLKEMVGGHPYLVRLALYHLSQKMTIQQLIKDAPTNAGIYQQHLLRHLETLENQQELSKVFKQIVAQEFVTLEKKTIQLYQLESMGLIKLEGNSARVSRRLYQLYFSDRLN